MFKGGKLEEEVMNLEVFCSNTFHYTVSFYWNQFPVAETYFSDILTELVFGRFQDHLIKSASMPTRRDLKDTWGPEWRERTKKTEILFFS